MNFSRLPAMLIPLLLPIAALLTPISANAKTWTGAVEVRNETGQKITRLHVRHRVGGLADYILQGATLNNNETSRPKVLRGKSGSNDTWEIDFYLADGRRKTRIGKQCNFEPEDASKTVIVVLHKTKFSIHYPQSDCCQNNTYK